MTNTKSFAKHLLAITIAAAIPGHAAFAAVSAEEAKALGTTLTPIGATKAGNADGTIPPYTGGNTKAPAGFTKGSGIRPNPFAADKVRLTIDAKNMAQHADKLTEGTKALMQRYSTFRVDVYPTQRSVTFPDYVLKNTQKQATTVKTENDGLSVVGAHAGFPFPIPKNGNEAMWNHLVRFNGPSYEGKFRNLNVDSSGRVALSTEGTSTQEFPFWNPDSKSDIFWRLKSVYTGPARRAGEALMVFDPLDIGTKDRRAWTYLPGQRRVKVAPDLSFDTPNPATAGATTFDDTFIFNGSMERFDFKLIGKKEIYVPYNAYDAVYTSKQADLVTPNHLNPDLIRWELHRVWVVEAKLKEGKRHVYSKRTFYLDEDSWSALASDNYDARGQMYRAGFAFMAPSYDIPAPYTDMFAHYDLVSRVYSLTGYVAETGGVRQIAAKADKEWTADSLAGSGIR